MKFFKNKREIKQINQLKEYIIQNHFHSLSDENVKEEITMKYIEEILRKSERSMIVILSGKHLFGLSLSNQTHIQNLKFVWDIQREKDVFFFHVFPSGKIVVKKRFEFQLTIDSFLEKITFHFENTSFSLWIDKQGKIRDTFVYCSGKERIEKTFDHFYIVN